MTWPGATVPPAGTRSWATTPLTGAATSKATLSVSISIRISSFSTRSPVFLRHSPRVPSVTLSPIVGVATSIGPAEGVAAVMAGAAAGAGDTAACAPAMATAPSFWPGTTVTPSSAEISVTTPSCGAATSRETLSVSSSTRISSLRTVSPTFLVQRATVASLTDSPSVGVMISAMNQLLKSIRTVALRRPPDEGF